MEIRRKAAVLLASTALALPGAALAQGVTLSGFAEMGVKGGKGAKSATDAGIDYNDHKIKSQFHTDVDVTFTMTGVTDQGITFGTAVDLDEAGALGAGSTVEDKPGKGNKSEANVEVYVEGPFGRVALGDTDGALDWAVAGEVPSGPGSIDDAQEHRAWRTDGLDGGNDGQILRYNSTSFPVGFGTIAFAVSAELDDTKSMAKCYGGSKKLQTEDLSDDDANTGTNARKCAGMVNKASDSNNPPDVSLYDPGVDSDDAIVAAGLTMAIPAGGGSVSLGLGYQGGQKIGEWDLGDKHNEDTTADEVPARNGPKIVQTKYVQRKQSEVALSVGYKTDMFAIGVSGSQIDNAESKIIDPIGSASIETDRMEGRTAFTDAQHIAVGASVTTGPFSFGANWGSMDYKDAAFDDYTGVGLSAGYDLGGGAQILAGWGQSDTDATDPDDEDAKLPKASRWSLGLKMAF